MIFSRCLMSSETGFERMCIENRAFQYGGNSRVLWSMITSLINYIRLIKKWIILYLSLVFDLLLDARKPTPCPVHLPVSLTWNFLADRRNHLFVIYWFIYKRAASLQWAFSFSLGKEEGVVLNEDYVSSSIFRSSTWYFICNFFF